MLLGDVVHKSFIQIKFPQFHCAWWDDQLLLAMHASIQNKMIIHAAYGSQRHLAVYMELGLQPDQIFIHGKKLKKPLQDCQVGDT